MSKADEGRPEPVLFLLEAVDAMDSYYEKHHSYPSEWNQLDIDFANGPFRVNDFGTHPTMQDRSSWQPKGCAFTYWIVIPDHDNFGIEARDKAGRPVYKITKNMSEPKLLVEKEPGAIKRRPVK